MTPLFVGSRIDVCLSPSFWWVQSRHAPVGSSRTSHPALQHGYVRTTRSQASRVIQHANFASFVRGFVTRASGVPVDTGPADAEDGRDIEPAMMSGVMVMLDSRSQFRR